MLNMYIKLTRLDNSPIWINAAFVVTIEPRKGGGSIVVPIGDGFDYDVRETPEQVLAMIDGAPASTVVPVPTVTISDANRKAIESAVVTPPDSEPVPEPHDPPKAAKKPRKSTATRKSVKSRKPAMPLPVDQVERLRKMAPKSMAKLNNTLVTQFKVSDAPAVVNALAANGVFTLDDTHVVWSDAAPVE